MRIISLVPSITETLCELGLSKNIVGCTSFCMHPYRALKNVERIGGTKDPDIEKIKRLKPTHVLLNKEENRKEDFQILKDFAFCLVTDIKCVEDVPNMYLQLGNFLNVEPNAQEKSHLLRDKIALSKSKVNADFTPCVYLIWRDPWMCVGLDTYIASALALLGFSITAFQTMESQYPELTLDCWSSIPSVEKDLTVFFSSEPYPFRKRDLVAFNERFSKKVGSQFKKCDGKLLSWYGTSTLELLESIENNTFEDKVMKDF